MPDDPTTPDPTTEQTPPADDSAQTFDAAYVAKLRAEAAKYRTDAKANAEAAKRLAEIEERNKSESEKAVDAARREAAAQTRTELVDSIGKRLVGMAVTAYATGKLADPSDAVALAELDGIKVDAESLEVDDAAVRKAVDDLLKRKPHLAAKRGPGSADGGARGTQTDIATSPELRGESRMAAAYAAASR